MTVFLRKQLWLTVVNNQQSWLFLCKKSYDWWLLSICVSYHNALSHIKIPLYCTVMLTTRQPHTVHSVQGNVGCSLLNLTLAFCFVIHFMYVVACRQDIPWSYREYNASWHRVLDSGYGPEQSPHSEVTCPRNGKCWACWQWLCWACVLWHAISDACAVIHMVRSWQDPWSTS